MNGDRQLFAMRSSGHWPVAVWITDSDDDYSRTTARDWHLQRNSFDGQYHARLRIAATDIPEALDLRCVMGLSCHVTSDRGAERFERLFNAVKAAGGASVVGVHGGEINHQTLKTEPPHG